MSEDSVTGIKRFVSKNFDSIGFGDITFGEDKNVRIANFFDYLKQRFSFLMSSYDAGMHSIIWSSSYFSSNLVNTPVWICKV